jgi:hypothetical protein
MMTRVQWILVASALLLTQALMQGCSSCGDNDRVPNLDGGDSDGGRDAGRDGSADGGGGGMAGVEVNPTTGLRTTEQGGQATFTIVLTGRPSANVTIGLSSSDPGEGSVRQEQLVFTPSNWNAPQQVTVNGVDDDEKDGTQEYTVLTAPAESDDDNYDGLDAEDVSVTNTDDETAGITVSAADGLQTTEAGGTVEFSVVLNSAPSSDVIIALSSDDTGEGTVAPASLTFTPDNWAAPQQVTTTGQNDDEADGLQTYKIVTAPAASDDEEYEGVDADDVTIENVDDDTAGFFVTRVSGLRTSENGDQATFAVRLNTQPSAPVTISLTNSDDTEVAIAHATLTFTPENWEGLQEVIVTGRDDDDEDGEQPWEIITGPAISDDARYADVDPPNVAGRNVDNDSAGVTIRLPEDELETSEDGAQVLFTVELNSRPAADVTISFATSNGDEVSVSPVSLLFTRADWSSRRTVTLTGVDDPDADGGQQFTVTVAVESTDNAYDVLDLANIVGTNRDNDTPGVTVAAATGLQTRENGQQASFTVRLNSRPTDEVSIDVSSGNTDEVTLSTGNLTFTPDNWNSPQTVTLTGVDDPVRDGDRQVLITLTDTESDDAAYDALPVDEVNVVNRDDDTPGFRLTPSSGLVTTEGGGQATFTVALTTRPSSSVSVGLVSSDTDEARLSAAQLTFTPDNWNAPQTVTLTGQNDDLADGPQPFYVALAPVTSDDDEYDAMAVLHVTGTNTDNDTAGITLAGATGLITTEGGQQASFSVVLNSEPTADVTIPIVSLTATEGIAAPASLVFTPVNWAAPQMVTVTGQNDDFEDGPQVYFVRIGPASGDTNYAAVTVPNVTVLNVDNDTAGVTVTPTTQLLVGEGGDQDTFTVNLNSRPTANVTFAIAASDAGEATVSPASLTFTTDNWAAPQTVIVTGRGDLLQDGHQEFRVGIGPGVSTDPKYNTRTVPDLEGLNLDVDSPAIRIIAGTLRTDEDGGQNSFQVVLLNQPSDDVVIPIASSDMGEGVPSPLSLTFTTDNWASPQVITITGQDDEIDDGSQPYFILVGPAESTDPEYGGRTVLNVPVTNTDDDTAGVTLEDTDALTTTEAGGDDTFTIVLNSEPTSDVTFRLSSSDPGEATVSPAVITFTTVNWNAPRTVTLTGVNDAVDDGAQPFLVAIGSPESDDPNYEAQFVASVQGSNTDDDTAGVTINAGPLVTTEAGGSASFTVVLNSEPTADVVIPVVSGRLTEGAVTVPASGNLTFTSANWMVAQTVTLTGQDDFVEDGDQTYAVHLGPIQSSDATYSVIPIADLSASNTDNDTAGITVAPLGPLTTTEAAVTATFTVVLNSQPTGPVALALTSNDTTEASVSPAGLTFTAANWNIVQTVTVTGQNDFVADGDQPFAITIGPAVSTDPNYDTTTVLDVLGTNTDNDVPGFVLSTSSVTTFEFGVSTTFTVRLTSEPTAALTFDLTSSVPGEAAVAPASLTFTAANWNVDQTVTVTGQDDAVLDGNQAYVIETGPAVSADVVYAGLTPADVTGTNVEAALSCNEWHTRHAALPTGEFPLDTDRTGPNPRFMAFCDMDTDGGGFTLLAWSEDTTVGTVGVPYPGRDYCATLDCPRGSGVPFGSVDALFDNSSQFGQGQSATIGSLVDTYDILENYEYAGLYTYASLASLSLEPEAFTGCAGVATGTYEDLTNTAASDGEVVYLNSGLHRDANPAFGDFRLETNSYTWSVGVRGSYCNVNSTVPGSYLGTWDDGQYGPGVPSASGSYSIWVR